ncbi:MAG: L-threonylcarbamoyladenylate synthase [Bacteroidota bacterium]
MRGRAIATRVLPTGGRNRGRSIATAARLLREGCLVAFPTETVYGLGAGVFNRRALERLFRVKGRPRDNPLIVHIWHLDQIWRLVETIPVMFWVLSERFWPGPLTLVLRKSRAVPDVVTAGLPTVAIRMPDHAVARALLKETGVPVAAPSANIAGRPSPTRASHVLEDLGGKIAAVLEGGASRIGVESTVLDISGRRPLLLRPGGTTREELEAALGMRVVSPRGSRLGPRSPGMKYRHYAPRAAMLLFEGGRPQVLAGMRSACRGLLRRGIRAGVLCEGSAASGFRGADVASLGGGGAERAARRLFTGLRMLDGRGVEVILCQGFPEERLGHALMNRLRKAAGRRIRC